MLKATILLNQWVRKMLPNTYRSLIPQMKNREDSALLKNKDWNSIKLESRLGFPYFLKKVSIILLSNYLKIPVVLAFVPKT